MFYELNPTEEIIVSALEKNGEMYPIDLSSAVGMTLSEVNSILFALEMSGVVRSMAGGMFCII